MSKSMHCIWHCISSCEHATHTHSLELPSEMRLILISIHLHTLASWVVHTWNGHCSTAVQQRRHINTKAIFPDIFAFLRKLRRKKKIDGEFWHCTCYFFPLERWSFDNTIYFFPISFFVVCPFLIAFSHCWISCWANAESFVYLHFWLAWFLFFSSLRTDGILKDKGSWGRRP